MEDVEFWEISNTTDASEAYLQEQESIYDNDITDIKNKFFELAKACGMESGFPSDLNLEETISYLASPHRDSRHKDSLMTSQLLDDTEIRRKLTYADKILAELAADCSAVSSVLIDSLNEDDTDTDSIESNDITQTDDVKFASQYTSYRKAVELNPMFSFSTSVNSASRANSKDSTLPTVDSTWTTPTSDCIDKSKTQRVSSAVDSNLKSRCLSRSRDYTQVANSQTITAAPSCERLQPEGAENDCTPKAKTSPVKSLLRKSHNSSFMKEKSQQRKVSRSTRSIPLASSTMIQDVSFDDDKQVKKRHPSVIEPKRERTPSQRHSRRQTCEGESMRQRTISPRKTPRNDKSGVDKSSKNLGQKKALNSTSHHCSLQFIEPLSVIEPTNRDMHATSCDSTYGSLSNSDADIYPLTSTKIWKQPKICFKQRKRNVCSKGGHLQRSDFQTVPLSPQSRGYYSHERSEVARHTFQDESHQIVPNCSKVAELTSTDDSLFVVTSMNSEFSNGYPIYNSFMTSRDSGLSSVSSDSLHTSSVFKKPKCATRKRQYSEKEHDERNSIPRTSTPMPHSTPVNMDAKAFNKRQLSKRMRRFNESLHNETVSDIRTLASL